MDRLDYWYVGKASPRVGRVDLCLRVRWVWKLLKILGRILWETEKKMAMIINEMIMKCGI